MRNLLLGCRSFSELRTAAPGISRTLLTQRLRMLDTNGSAAAPGTASAGTPRLAGS